jgi:hypothetical protein
VCSAVAAADRRAAWFLALASFVAQSGLILSVVITVEALAEIDVVLRRGVEVGASEGLPKEFKDDDDDIAEVTFPRGVLWPIPA